MTVHSSYQKRQLLTLRLASHLSPCSTQQRDQDPGKRGVMGHHHEGLTPKIKIKLQLCLQPGAERGSFTCPSASFPSPHYSQPPQQPPEASHTQAKAAFTTPSAGPTLPLGNQRAPGPGALNAKEGAMGPAGGHLTSVLMATGSLGDTTIPQGKRSDPSWRL